jgi:hypothetical protein
MNRRTFDIAVPLLYLVAIIVAVVIRDALVVGAVASIGALLVVLYFASLRPKSKV